MMLQLRLQMLLGTGLLLHRAWQRSPALLG
jgi:hypothetical protein